MDLYARVERNSLTREEFSDYPSAVTAARQRVKDFRQEYGVFRLPQAPTSTGKYFVATIHTGVYVHREAPADAWWCQAKLKAVLG